MDAWPEDAVDKYMRDNIFGVSDPIVTDWMEIKNNYQYDFLFIRGFHMFVSEMDFVHDRFQENIFLSSF